MMAELPPAVFRAVLPLALPDEAFEEEEGWLRGPEGPGPEPLAVMVCRFSEAFIAAAPG
jgi:hypothetical protein